MLKNEVQKKICLVSFSNNSDHQNVIYSMFEELNKKHEVYTIGRRNPKSNIAAHTEKNFYVDCPDRPGIEKGTFDLKELFRIKKIIVKRGINLLYFESQHIWNVFVMLLCPTVKKVVAVHDVIPHDGNRAMALSNFVTCHMANHVILRNKKDRDLLIKKYFIRPKKITCFELWRDYPKIVEPMYTKTFLYFGRIRKYKGFELFVEIIKRTPDVEYRVVGKADDESSCLVDLLKGFSNVSLSEEEVSDAQMIDELKKADWIVLPYSNATQSGVIVDAYRFSRPVISFNVGAICEQIVDGETGFLIEAGNIDAFANKVNEVNSFSEDELNKYAKAAYEFGLKKYSAEIVAEDFYEVLENVR